MLSVFTLEEADQWNRIVKGFKQYDVYYLAEYTKAFRAHGDGEPMLFYYEDSNMKAINVVMKRDIERDVRFQGKIPRSSLFDLATPYGYGGFLLEGNVDDVSVHRLNTEYSDYCQQAGIVSEFVRFHPVLNNYENLEYMYDLTTLNETITMNLQVKEDIWNNLSTNKKRWIKKLKNVGVEVYWGRNPELFDEFQEMYFMTMDKNQARDYYYFDRDFFNSICQDCRYHAMIFYAVYEGIKIGMVLVLHGNGQLHHHFSASHIGFQHLASTNLLMYEIALWGSENGYNTFHLGGGVGSSEDSLYKFKSGFNSKSKTVFSIGKKIFLHNQYKELLQKLRDEGNISETERFFPAYRS